MRLSTVSRRRALLFAASLVAIGVALVGGTWWFFWSDKEGVLVTTDPCELWRLPDSYDFTASVEGEGLVELGSDVEDNDDAELGKRAVRWPDLEIRVSGGDHHAVWKQTNRDGRTAEAMTVGGKHYAFRGSTGPWTKEDNSKVGDWVWQGPACEGLENVRHKGSAKTEDGRTGEHYTADFREGKVPDFWGAELEEEGFDSAVGLEYWVRRDGTLLQALATLEFSFSLFELEIASQTARFLYEYSGFDDPNLIEAPEVADAG